MSRQLTHNNYCLVETRVRTRIHTATKTVVADVKRTHLQHQMLDGLMQGADRDLVKIWQKMNAPRFDNIMLKTKTVGARALPVK